MRFRAFPERRFVGQGVMLAKYLLLVYLAVAAEGSGSAADFHNRLVAKGDAKQWPFFGGAGVPHHKSDPPPPQFLDASTCDTKCSFDPLEVKRNGDTVTIKYKVANPGTATLNDRVALFEEGLLLEAPVDDGRAGARRDLGRHYLEYFHANVDVTGYGQRTVKLYNFRVNLVAQYFRGHEGDDFTNTTYPYIHNWAIGGKCLCRSDPIKFALGSEEPTQGHISLTGDSSEMQVTWVSGGKTGFVELEGGDKINSTATTYAASDMCQPPATTTGAWGFRDPGMIHTATIKGLKAGMAYTYRYGNGNLAADWATFRTEPDASQEWLAIAFGDMGIAGSNTGGAGGGEFWEQPGANLVQLDVQARNPSLVVHFGDLSYARSVGYIWDIWGTQIEPIARVAPYMVSLGNHEYDHTVDAPEDPSGTGAGFHPAWGNYGDDGGGECGVPVVHRFPNPPQNGFGIFWYSYNYANTHWVMLSSEHDYTAGSKQYVWLESDLASVDRAKTPWLIVTSHRPAYNSEDYAGDYYVATNMSAILDTMLVKNKVNMFLAGHYHSYQRTCEVADKKCQPGRAPQHITVGSAGMGIDNVQDRAEGLEWTLRTVDTWGTLSLRIRPEKIVGEFWGAENPNRKVWDAPADIVPFQLIDSFEVLPWDETSADEIVLMM